MEQILKIKRAYRKYSLEYHLIVKTTTSMFSRVNFVWFCLFFAFGCYVSDTTFFSHDWKCVVVHSAFMQPLSELPIFPIGSHKAGLLVVGPFIHPSFGVAPGCQREKFKNMEIIMEIVQSTTIGAWKVSSSWWHTTRVKPSRKVRF